MISPNASCGDLCSASGAPSESPRAAVTQSNLISDYTIYSSLTALFTGLSVASMDHSSTVFECELVERKRAEEASVLAPLQLKSVFDAVTLYRTHHASIDLVITDMGMPEMGGEELYGHLRRIQSGVKVIVASGYLDGTITTSDSPTKFITSA